MLGNVMAVLLGEQCAAFLKDHNVFPSGSGNRLLAPLDPEDGGIMILQNIRNYLPDDLVSHPRKLEFNVVSYLESTLIK